MRQRPFDEARPPGRSDRGATAAARVRQALARLTLLGVLGVSLLAAGCGSKGAVSLTAAIEDPALEVRQGALGSTLAGSFVLVLELGSVAPRGTEVTLGALGLRRGSEVLVEPLALDADTPFPVEVGVGDSVRVGFAVDSGSIVDAAQASAVCAGQVVVAGTLSDTLSEGKPTPVASSPFTPTCPD